MGCAGGAGALVVSGLSLLCLGAVGDRGLLLLLCVCALVRLEMAHCSCDISSVCFTSFQLVL